MHCRIVEMDLAKKEICTTTVTPLSVQHDYQAKIQSTHSSGLHSQSYLHTENHVRFIRKQHWLPFPSFVPNSSIASVRFFRSSQKECDFKTGNLCHS
mmetsp:Transcript_14002/g.18712  ORF Transcript_14002/g.18712 Transcript_14002/m.18712 type:complete len:97 (+) Transcript_14002:65-355(+)